MRASATTAALVAMTLAGCGAAFAHPLTGLDAPSFADVLAVVDGKAHTAK